MANLTGQAPYQKGQRLKKKANRPTAKQRERWERVRALGCIITWCQERPVTIHHCGTGGGGRKKHDLVIPLCERHHLGSEGINSLTGGMSRRDWEERFGLEADHLRLVATLLGELT